MIWMETSTPIMESPLVQTIELQPLEEEEHVLEIFVDVENTIDIEITYTYIKWKGKDQMEAYKEKKEEGESK